MTVRMASNRIGLSRLTRCKPQSCNGRRLVVRQEAWTGCEKGIILPGRCLPKMVTVRIDCGMQSQAQRVSPQMTPDEIAHLFAEAIGVWRDRVDQIKLADTIRALDARYSLGEKIAHERGVAEIVAQMLGRLADSYGRLSNLPGKRILDIACGSNTSKAPASPYVNTPFGEMTIGRPSTGYTALFEPWFCRILLEVGAIPVGLDFGDLEQEAFTHYRVDLGKEGALDFLPDHSFDAVQDSRLFGSPEFTAQFRSQGDHLRVAREIRRQEHRLLKPGGIVIHSDAEALLRR
jgi:hypothetical protein